MANTFNAITSGVGGIATTGDSSGSFEFQKDGGSQVTIDANGNVGIGTSSPIAKLQVFDSTSCINLTAGNGGVSNITARYTTDVGSPNVTLRKGRGTYESPSAVATNDFAGQLVFQAFAGTNNRNIGAISGVVENYVSDTDISGQIRFSTNAGGTTTTERMRITSAGEVYIAGTTDQGAYNLQCNGTGVWGAGAYVNGSDARIKDNIAPLDSGLDVVEKLNPVTYKYKEDWSKDQSTQTGFIAQELLVALEGKSYVDGVVQQGGEYMSVAYQNIIPILTKAIQELKAELDTVKSELATLKGLSV